MGKQSWGGRRWASKDPQDTPKGNSAVGRHGEVVAVRQEGGSSLPVVVGCGYWVFGGYLRPPAEAYRSTSLRARSFLGIYFILRRGLCTGAAQLTALGAAKEARASWDKGSWRYSFKSHRGRSQRLIEGTDSVRFGRKGPAATANTTQQGKLPSLELACLSSWNFFDLRQTNRSQVGWVGPDDW